MRAIRMPAWATTGITGTSLRVLYEAVARLQMRLRLSVPASGDFASFRTLFLFVGFSALIFAGFRGLLFWTSADASAPVGLLDASGVFGVGLVYDLAFMAYALIPAVLYLWLMPARALASRVHRWLSVLIFAAALFGLFMILISEWLFWDEFQARFNFIAVDYLVYRQEVSDNIAQSYPVAALVAVALTLAVTTCGMVHLRILAAVPQVRTSFWRRGRAAAVLLLPALVAGQFLGQGLSETSGDRVINEIARNGPYQFFAAFRANTLDYRTFYRVDDDEALSIRLQSLVSPRAIGSQLYDIARWQPARPSLPLAAFEDGGPVDVFERRQNIVMITIESLSATFMARYGGDPAMTPNLDALMRESLAFTQAFATGTRTVRGLEALTLSVPPTPGRSLVKRPDAPAMQSLGSVLADQGYDTAFLYGGRGYFDNMNAFFEANGYRTVDQTALAEEGISFANAWGVADEDLYRRALDEADAAHAAGRPFFFHVMTTSNHRPYTYPEGRVDIPSGTGRTGAVQYTDWAIGQFMDQARAQPWFEDTLFVIVSDHCASCAGHEAITVANYHVPLMIYAPGRVVPREVDTVASQIDVAPTVLAMLGIGYQSEFFGRDILSTAPDQGRALIATYLRLGLFDGEQLVYLSPEAGADLIRDPLGEPTLGSADEAPELLLDAMAYYQGADYRINAALHGSAAVLRRASGAGG
jgi:phosphoglycerol transferase MdoB-like AlkP superfamily enzyme